MLASAAAGALPLLISMLYAPFAYLVWPGPVSADGKLAMSRWKLTVTRQTGGITVQAAEDGHSMASVSHFYPGGARCTYSTPTSAPTPRAPLMRAWRSLNTQGQVLP